MILGLLAQGDYMPGIVLGGGMWAPFLLTRSTHATA